jgi:hypothetical protein
VTRANHWVKANHQCRIPKRWVTFDTESRTEKGENEEIQRWASGAAVRWRRDLKTGEHEERATFDSALDLWSWVSDYCMSGVRTIVYAHNLGHDIRISDVFSILPLLGFKLEWCNLDSNVSAMTWRSDHGTLVLCDLFTWIPKPLHDIGRLVGLEKLRMPDVSAVRREWDTYCQRDADIVALAVKELIAYIDSEKLGNWQPTGAGMAYSTWRHRFMTHKVLIHDNEEVLKDERSAMHTGRAEAWRHGVCSGDMWSEVDLRSAYTRIAAEEEVPAKYKFSCGGIISKQYVELQAHYRLLCKVRVTTDLPVAPFNTGDRTIWPVGTFDTWLWDCEVDELLAEGQTVHIQAVHAYSRGPVLRDWATWVLASQHTDRTETPDVVKAWLKHSGRSLIGRLSLRVPSWEPYGENPFSNPGLSYDVDTVTGKISRMMHVGNQTFIETASHEGRDSCPQITGWIMAKCRALLWRAMRSAGLDNIAHVDTDCVLVNTAGLANLRSDYWGVFNDIWQIKATWGSLLVYGPRSYRAGRERKMSGIPKKAVEVEYGRFKGEKWNGLASDMMSGRAGAVTVMPGVWHVNTEDPRRLSAADDAGRTVAIVVNQ